jgi:hypothetical protein
MPAAPRGTQWSSPSRRASCTRGIPAHPVRLRPTYSSSSSALIATPAHPAAPLPQAYDSVPCHSRTPCHPPRGQHADNRALASKNVVGVIDLSPPLLGYRPDRQRNCRTFCRLPAGIGCWLTARSIPHVYRMRQPGIARTLRQIRKHPGDARETTDDAAMRGSCGGVRNQRTHADDRMERTKLYRHLREHAQAERAIQSAADTGARGPPESRYRE